MDSTRPFFVLSSGRSGSKLLDALLRVAHDVEVCLDYHGAAMGQLAVLAQQDLVDRGHVAGELTRHHGAAVRYSEAPQWGDVSSRLGWMVPMLRECFPTARFVHLVRDGRASVSAQLYRSGEEPYDDRSVGVVMDAIEAGGGELLPPPEPRYWWPLPRVGSPQWEAFRSWSPFERLAWQWGESNRKILTGLAGLPPDQVHTVHLEDLVGDPLELHRLMDFFGRRATEQQADLLRKPPPGGIFRRVALTDGERCIIDELAGDVMGLLGYDREQEHLVAYA